MGWATPVIILVHIVGGVWVINTDHVPGAVQAGRGKVGGATGGEVGRVDVFSSVRWEVGGGVTGEEPTPVAVEREGVGRTEGGTERERGGGGRGVVGEGPGVPASFLTCLVFLLVKVGRRLSELSG